MGAWGCEASAAPLAGANSAEGSAFCGVEGRGAAEVEAEAEAEAEAAGCVG